MSGRTEFIVSNKERLAAGSIHNNEIQGAPHLQGESTAGTAGAKEFILIVLIGFFSALAALTVLSVAGFEGTALASRLLASAITGVITGLLVFWLVLSKMPASGSGRAKEMPKPAAVGEETTITDPLTGIMNRHGITISVLDAMSLGERYGYPLSIALLDIDHLRSLNVEHGQEFGDQVLATIAGIIADSLRMPDKVGRFSGQQFLLVLPHTESGDATAIADRTRSLIADYDFDAGGQRVKLTASVGVTQYQQNEDLESLLSRAGKGIEEAREKGRNTIATV